jgi:hypothetical protein
MMSTKVSVVGVVYPVPVVKKMLQDEGKKFGIEIEVVFN